MHIKALTEKHEVHLNLPTHQYQLYITSYLTVKCNLLILTLKCNFCSEHWGQIGVTLIGIDKLFCIVFSGQFFLAKRWKLTFHINSGVPAVLQYFSKAVSCIKLQQQKHLRHDCAWPVYQHTCRWVLWPKKTTGNAMYSFIFIISSY